MLLKAGELTVRSAGEGDCALLCRWWNDGAVMAHAGFPLGLGTTPEKIAASLAGDSDEGGRRLIVERDGRPIGEMSYRDADGGAAEIGIKLCDPAERERGYGRVLLSLLIGELFSRGWREIILDTNLNNTRAQHVYEKLGFARVGVRRDAWRDQLGQPQSAVDYRLTPDRFVSFAEGPDGAAKSL